jgi:hypothetical protein
MRNWESFPPSILQIQKMNRVQREQQKGRFQNRISRFLLPQQLASELWYYHVWGLQGKTQLVLLKKGGRRDGAGGSRWKESAAHHSGCLAVRWNARQACASTEQLSQLAPQNGAIVLLVLCLMGLVMRPGQVSGTVC